MATSTEKDDQLEELQEKLHRLQSDNEKMRQSLDAGMQEKAYSSETVASLQRDVEEHKEGLEQHRNLCFEKEGEIQRLLAANKDLQMESENMKTMVSLYWPSNLMGTLTVGVCRGSNIPKKLRGCITRYKKPKKH
jgi:predicted nuclease with TOPRIM domain